MIDQRLTAKTELTETPHADDVVYIVDVSDTTDSPQGSSKKIKYSNLVDNTGGGAITPTPKGILYSKDTWTDTSDFTAFGNATAVMSGSKINIGTTTNGSYENYITLGNTTGLNKWKSTIEIKVINAPAATTYGLGLGLRSQHATPAHRIHFVSTIGLATASNNIYMIQGVGYNIIGTSATSFSFSQNDIIRLTVEQDLDIITSTFFNVTTGQVLVESYTYTLPLNPFPCNTADFAIHMLGGTYEMQSMKLETKDWEKSKVMFVGDSKTNGFQGDSFLGSFPQQFNTLIGGVADNSGGKDTTDEVLLKIPEIIDLAPQKVVLNIGSNDKRFGKSFVQWQTNYDSIVTQLEAAGITVYHLLQLNESSGLFFTDYNNHITTTYTSDKIIDAGIVPLYTDNVHPNQQAMDQIFMAVVSKIGSLV